jgi:2,4-dienoyl-CoA reductase-like NADH-dependent reductase (Old Yellow Enzyme family)
MVGPSTLAGNALMADAAATALSETGRLRFPFLFSPLVINGVALTNRLIYPSMGIDMANLDGTFSEGLAEFYDGLVGSGCGLVLLGNATVSPDSVLQLRGLRMYEERHADALQGFIARAAAKGVVVGVQLQHYGGQATTVNSGKPVLTPSGVASPSAQRRDPGYKAQAMSLEQIDLVREQFVHAARLCVRAGARFVQFQSSNGYLLSSFLSPRTNLRQDMYGGDPQRRARLLVDIVREVKTVIGREAVLGVRLQVDDCMGPEGLLVEDLKDVIPLLEKAGVDMIEASMSTGETFSSLIDRTPERELHLQQQVRKAKSYATVPMSFAGFVDSLETAERLLATGVADMVGMVRALFADNDLILKTLAGREEDIHRCLWDGNCFRDKSNPAFNRVYCCVNPKYKRPVLSSAQPTRAEARQLAARHEEEHV